MNVGQMSTAGTAALLISVLNCCDRSQAQQMQDPIVRLAELEIDPGQLDAYKVALKEEVETPIRVEPGVLTLYAVSVKDRPSHIRIFEIYADAEAYHAHLRTTHFQRYKVATEKMVKSLRLIETDPILLRGKTSPRLLPPRRR